ncbi:hypothetical protein Nocox_24405 [Nonomuraea coxensis DSM 45129]|uniref:Uncharacterized protein n=1 Tax=Nonomuraea coxensis DSM 45129 TaxID=1122611 RepID=A0ABX8U484_9ACTN|nr:hypothetical protein [Nonomuraea coxensis]QYC42484.1 hypothetical protein Nocox_24405 [Nonomuraea coxensis DSM 45129]
MAPKASATSATGSMADIRFDDSLDEDQRRCVEQSIAGLRERSRERIASRRAAQAESSKPAREANAKLVKYLEEHPDAALMFQAMRGRSLLAEDGQADAEPVLGRPTLSPVLMDVEVRENLKLFGTPFHYDWKWSDSDGGNFPRMSVSRETAVAKIDVGIRQIEGDSTWITAHAGVGVAIRVDKQVGAIGRAYRTTSEYGKVTQHGFDADATSEGGTELTVFEDGRFVTSATDKRWRIRVAGDTPNTSHSSEGFAVGELMEVTWVMRPGRTYTFNLGAWVYAEAHDGFDLFGLIRESTAVSSIDSRLLLLSLFT